MDNKDFYNLCKEKLTDRDIEELWQELEDVPVYENKDGYMCLDIDWRDL